MADRYPESRITPVLGLMLEGMSVVAADNMIILDNSVSPAPFAANVAGFTVDQLFKSAVASGDVDLYTVPAGKKAIVCLSVYNPTLGTIQYRAQVKLGGTGSYLFLNGVNTSVTTVTQNNSSCVAVLEEGDVFAINTSALGLNVFGSVYTFNSDARLKTPRVTSLTSGDNTIYTCPAGYKAYLIGTPSYIYSSSNFPVLSIGNQSGGALSYKVNLVPSGSTPAVGNQISGTQSIANNDQGIMITGPLCLLAGDSLSVNTTGTGTKQWARCHIMEVPVPTPV